jgi:endonuclease/exonuclease/phosphatase family metal-dependent hydrolase
MRRLGAWAANAAYGVSLLSGAVWALAWTLTDRWSWTQWIWWFPWLGYAGACLPALLASTFDRRPAVRRWRVGAIGAGLVIAACGVFRDVGWRGRPDPERSTIRVVQWNAPSPDPEEAAAPSAALLALDADLVVVSNPWRFFQRVRAEWSEEGYDLVQTGSFAFASRLPVLEARPLRSPPGSRMALVRIDARATWGRPVSLLAVDFPSDPKSSRMAFAARVAEAVANQDLPPLDAVLGDFNITRGSASLEAAFPGHREAFAEAGSGWGASFEEPRPLFHIDLLLAGPEVRVAWCRLWRVGPRHRAQETWLKPVD